MNEADGRYLRSLPGQGQRRSYVTERREPDAYESAHSRFDNDVYYDDGASLDDDFQEAPWDSTRSGGAAPAYGPSVVYGNGGLGFVHERDHYDSEHSRRPHRPSVAIVAGGLDAPENWRDVQAAMRANSAAASAKAALLPGDDLRHSVHPLKRLKHLLRRFSYLLDQQLQYSAVQAGVLALIFTVFVLVIGQGVIFVRRYNYMYSLAGTMSSMAMGGANGTEPNQQTSYTDATWLAFNLLTDPGYGVFPERPEGLVYRTFTMAIILVGFLLCGIIVGLIVEKVQAKMNALKKGLAPVVESGHTVVLGWAEASLTIIAELCLANASEGGGVIVVLDKEDKMKMELDLLRFMEPSEMLGTQVVFRCGSRMRKADLEFVGVSNARSIIIVSNMNLDADTSDAETLQVVLNLSTLDLHPDISIAAEVRDADNEQLIKQVGDESLCTLSSHDIIGRLMLFFLRSPGLSRVYSSLLGFTGSEIYVQEWEELVGVRWADVAVRFPNAVPIGVRSINKEVLLNPPADYAIMMGEELIVLAEDNDSYACEFPYELGARRAFRAVPAPPLRPEVMLFAGWRRDVGHMVMLLDRLVEAGSELHMLASETVADRQRELTANGMGPNSLQNLRIIHHVGNTASQRGLMLVPLERLTGIVVLSEQTSGADVVYSDSHVLAALLLTRGLQAGMLQAAGSGPGAPGQGIGNFSAHSEEDQKYMIEQVRMIAEILDPRTQRTVNESPMVWSVCEFIQSNELVSKILAMISEEAGVMGVIQKLLGGSGGTLLEMTPADRILAADQDACFWELSRECLLSHGMTLCGYTETPLPDRSGKPAVPLVFLNPEDKDLRRNWHGCTLVTIKTDPRLLGLGDEEAH